MGSPAGSWKDLRDLLEFAATHSVRPSVTCMPLEEAEKALKQMHEGKIYGRIVLTMD
jgi:D-arabinose 1-dehydrogenase-like Zn-dependent alcohol dehydrogenase